MAEPHHYDKFIVQSLVGNGKWSSTTQKGQYFHIGTIPNRKGETYVAVCFPFFSSCCLV